MPDRFMGLANNTYDKIKDTILIPNHLFQKLSFIKSYHVEILVTKNKCFLALCDFKM